MQSLCAMGKKKDGGSYHLYDMEGVKVPTLKGAVFQTKAQKDAVEIYGDLLFLDSTHGLSSYLIQTSLPTLVDCYGESFICGIQFYQSENFANVSDGIQGLSLGKRQLTLVTDGAKCFQKIAKNFNFTQIRCQYHFRNNHKALFKQLSPTIRVKVSKAFEKTTHLSFLKR